VSADECAALATDEFAPEHIPGKIQAVSDLAHTHPPRPGRRRPLSAIQSRRNMVDTVPDPQTSPSEEQLRGTPYLIASDATSQARFAQIQNRSLQINQLALSVSEHIRSLADTLLAPFTAAIRTELVAESNRIEGYDWSSSTVKQAVATHRELLSAPLHTFLNALRHDPRVFEAVGLFRAHALAEEWARNGARPRAFEIRALHALIAAGETFAGSYKDVPNIIGGSPHRTTAPLDVPQQMDQLCTWWHGSAIDPILEATVVHAWLTHIHPFKDGNGRMARLLANVSLARSNYPPLILKSEADRGQYYDALSESDGGNILPLYDLCTKVVRRTVRIMSRPEYVEDVIHERLLISLETTHALWSQSVRDFASELEYHLERYDFGVQLMGYRDLTTFGLLLECDPDGNGWYLIVLDRRGRSVWLLWFGYSTSLMADSLA